MAVYSSRVLLIGLTLLTLLTAINGLCKYYEFTCDDGGCIDTDWKCDGMSDCEDNSDESDCPNGILECPEEHDIRCSDGVCVSVIEQCDGYRDCIDGDDELNCECKDDQFQCNNGVCIDALWVCDQLDDCGDNSDEVCECPDGEAKCSNEMCIPITWFCDGYNDCGNNSDEMNCENYVAPSDEYPTCSHSLATENNTLTLTCQSRGGFPLPTLQWDNVADSASTIEGDLVVATGNVRLTEEQENYIFSCKSFHFAYDTPKSCTIGPLQYSKRPDDGYPQCRQSHQNLVIGDTLILSCETRGGAPPATLVWSRDNVTVEGVRLTSGIMNQLDLVINITTDLEGAQFICTSNHVKYEQPQTCTIGPLHISSKEPLTTEAPQIVTTITPAPPEKSLWFWVLLAGFIVCVVILMCIVLVCCVKRGRNEKGERYEATTKSGFDSITYGVSENQYQATHAYEEIPVKKKPKWGKGKRGGYECEDATLAMQGISSAGKFESKGSPQFSRAVQADIDDDLVDGEIGIDGETNEEDDFNQNVKEIHT